MLCEWCGHTHPREALCERRPKWSRRGFLALFGAGIAGIAAGGLGNITLPVGLCGRDPIRLSLCDGGRVLYSRIVVPWSGRRVLSETFRGSHGDKINRVRLEMPAFGVVQRVDADVHPIVIAGGGDSVTVNWPVTII